MLLLDRHFRYSDQPPLLSSGQIQIDAFSHSFSKQACDWKALTAMTLGNLAYQLGKLGGLSLGAKYTAPFIGIASEVSVWRGTSSLLENSKHPVSWITDAVNFTSLRSLGFFVKNTNIVWSHSIQSSGIVASNQLTYTLQLTHAPQGSFIEQLLHAEFMNLQMNFGTAMAHQLTHGKILYLEKKWEVTAESRKLSKYYYDPFRYETNKNTALAVFKTDISEFYPRIKAIQKEYIDYLRTQGVLLREEKIPLWKFLDNLNSAPAWLKDFVRQYPHLEIERIIFNSDRLSENDEKSAHFLANMVRDVEVYWSLPAFSLYRLNFQSGEHIIDLHLMPIEILMGVRHLIPHRSPVKLRVSTELALHEEVVAMLAEHTRPFVIADEAHEIHGLKEVAPFIQMMHDYAHLMIMDRFTPAGRTSLLGIYKAARRVDPELLKKGISDENLGRILEGTFRMPDSDLFVNVFTLLSHTALPKAFLTCFKSELEISFPPGSPFREALFKAFQKVFEKDTQNLAEGLFAGWEKP